MKVNYVSVIKEYIRKSKEERFIIRASMDITPSPLWFKQLQLFWISSPGLFKLCPEPRLKQNEISVSIDDDPRATYWKQVLNGKYIRMALILKLLEEAEKCM